MTRPTTAPERIRSDGEFTAFTRIPYTSSTSSMAAPLARPTSPASPLLQFPIRFHRDTRNSDSHSTSSRVASLSSTSRSLDKGKAPTRSGVHLQAVSNGDEESVKSVQQSMELTYDRVRSPLSERKAAGFNARKNRNSLLGAATDALALKFGRKRPLAQQPPVPIYLPGVIEITAPPPDHEVEERNRLREMAAQAIGISPYMAQPDSHSLGNSTEDDEDEDALRTPADTSDLRRFGNMINSESAPDFTNKALVLDTNLSSSFRNPSFNDTARHRSGSMIHTRANSTTFSPIPPFPTNVLSLNPFLACNGHLPKYNQPASIRIFALSSKGWKNRYIIFTSPALLVTKGRTPASSYLHVFKSAGPDEKELERLEINEDSVIFVAEDEIGDRRNVIKVGGLEGGVTKPDTKLVKANQTIWHLQITNSGESQRWISTIKNAILGQRTVRAGLALPSTPAAFEPRGDLDVMLSIRAQGLTTTLQTTSIIHQLHEPTSPISPTDRNYASSISSQSVRSQTTVSKPTAVSTLKGLFTNRPRSSSRAASIDVNDRHHPHPQQDGFVMGNGMLPSTTNKLFMNPSSRTTYVPVHQRNTLSFAPSGLASDQSSDRKVLAERQAVQWVNDIGDQGNGNFRSKPENRANRSLSLSLQPPPRKRWGSMHPGATSPTSDHGFTFVNRDPTTTTVVTGGSPTHDEEMEPPSPVDFANPYDKRQRAPSLQSTSTRGSENASSIDRTSSSTTRNRRWSRPLPQRLTPPAGPPPAVPANMSVTKLNVHPYGLDDTPPATLHSPSQSQQSLISTIPSFSKRTSTSSTRSIPASNYSGSFVSSTTPSRPSRHSMPPPPRPAPTTALPPAPEPDTPTPPSLPTPPATKTSFRNSVTQRAMRLSMIAPKPPPSTTLPPRPDEVDGGHKTHKRRSSSSGTAYLDTIPEPSQHNHRQSTIISPLPPPLGPLPPTPHMGFRNESITPTPPISRHSSLKQRLRILSAPSPISSTIGLPPTPRQNPSYPSMISPSTTPVLHQFTHSTPTTPSGDKIAFLNNSNEQSSSFLNMNTPIASVVAPSFIYEEAAASNMGSGPELVDILDAVTSLSPPPRRHSKPIIESSWVCLLRNDEDDDDHDNSNGRPPISPTDSNEAPITPTSDNDDRPNSEERRSRAAIPQHPSRFFSLSPRASAVSLEAYH